MGIGSRYRPVRKCPACGSLDVARSHGHGLLESLMRLVLRLRAYRCRECMHRYFAWLNAARAPGLDEDKAA